MPGGSLKYLSICSGIEAATVAWHPLGWKPIGFSEIDDFTRKLLAHHYPRVPLHGDFTALKEKDYGTIDLLVGGTPCQSFSIAGLRKGLGDDRGNLTLEFIRLAKRACPRWLVWENVPGVLSIDEGRTFGAFLGGLAECGYGFAYRILDAQYFGVPQRRRRVFVIGYLGDWRPAAAVLFECESLRGDITPGRETRERIADSLTVGSNQCSGFQGDFVEQADVAGTLKGGSGNRGWPDPSDGNGGGLVARPLLAKANSSHREDAETYVAHSLRGEGFDASEDGTGRGIPLVPKAFGGGNTSGNIDVAAALNAGATQRQDFDTETLITIPISTQNATRGDKLDDGTGLGVGEDGDPAFTLQARRGHAVAFNVTFCDANGRRKDRPNGGLYVNETEQSKTVTSGGDCSTYIAFAQNCRDEVRMLGGNGDIAGALPAQPGMKQQTFVAFEPGSIARDAGPAGLSETCSTLRAEMGDNHPAVLGDMAVRRLTPRECERLQGFPDDYTLIPYRGKLAADGPRYKALGNSMAVPVMRWLGERIQKVDGRK